MPKQSQKTKATPKKVGPSKPISKAKQAKIARSISDKASGQLIEKLINSHETFEIRTVADPNNLSTSILTEALGKEAKAIGKLPTIPKDLYTINEKNLLEAMLFPITKEDFFDRFYTKKALIIRGSSVKRF